MSWLLMSPRLLTRLRMERWHFSYATWGSQRSSSSSSIPSVAAPRCASSPHVAPRRAFVSTGACGRAVRKAPCSTSSSWSPSCEALPARARAMPAALYHPWCRRIVTTSY